MAMIKVTRNSDGSINYSKTFNKTPSVNMFDIVNKYITMEHYTPYVNRYIYPKMTGDLDKVLFNGPATVIFEKGKKTVVKCMENDKPSKKKGFVMCLCKHLIGSTEWNHLVRPHNSKPNIEMAVAEALCEHILGRKKFKALLKEYVD